MKHQADLRLVQIDFVAPVVLLQIAYDAGDWSGRALELLNPDLFYGCGQNRQFRKLDLIFRIGEIKNQPGRIIQNNFLGNNGPVRCYGDG